jgi:translocation and assembly module TamB
MNQAALGRYLDGEEPDQEPRTTGHVHLKGSPASPTVEASTTVSFHGWPRLERDVIRASARSDGEGVGLEVTLVHDSTRVLTLEGRSGPFSVASGTSPLPDGTPIDLTLTSEPIDLGRFSPLLPPSVDVSGRLEIDATVKGDMPDLSLEGRLEARTVEVSLADGSRVTAEASIQLGGRTTAPTLSGEVRIPQAVILIPEEAPNLLPAEGTAVLWEETSFAAGDSLETAPRTPRPAPMTLPEGTTIDLTIRIPSRFLIRGRGLDVEMAGELQVELEEGMPTPVGSLRPVSGRLNLLGRTFRIDEGSVTFFGQDAVDPALDLGLRLDLSGTEFRVRVTGTAQAPELALSSTPEMPEGDILSFLLFGQRMDDLDSGQMGLLQDRTLDIAQSYAAARLEAAIGQRLGVDLVQIEDSLEEDEATTLTVGKYLSPKALVKLEQELGGSGGSALHLEYQLIRQLFLETFVSRELSSGAEVSWSKDY